MTSLQRLVAAALAAVALSSCTGSDEPIHFAVMGPAATDSQVDAEMGAELARREINAAGGIGGRRLEFLPKDDGGDPTQALRVAEELLQDPRVVAVVGPVNSGTTIAASQVFNEGLVALSTNASNPDVARAGPWVFRISASDSANALVLARHALETGSRVAVVYTNEDYGRGLAESFVSAYRAGRGEVLETDPVLRDTKDFAPYLRRMQARGVELVFVAGGSGMAERIIRQSVAMGYRPRFMGGDGLEGLVSAGPEFDGVQVGLPFHPESSPAARRFREAFRAVYGREPDSYPASGYDAVRLLARAVEAVGTDREKVREYLEGVGRPGGSPPFDGVTGVVRFDANGDPAQKPFQVAVIQRGGFALASAVTPPSEPRPASPPPP